MITNKEELEQKLAKELVWILMNHIETGYTTPTKSRGGKDKYVKCNIGFDYMCNTSGVVVANLNINITKE